MLIVIRSALLVAITVNLTRSSMYQVMTFHFRLSTGFERDTYFT